MRLADPRSSSWKSCPRLGRKGGGTDQGGTHRVESGRSDVSAWAVRRTGGISFGARLRGFRNGRRGGSGRDRVEIGRSGQFNPIIFDAAILDIRRSRAFAGTCISQVSRESEPDRGCLDLNAIFDRVRAQNGILSKQISKDHTSFDFVRTFDG